MSIFLSASLFISNFFLSQNHKEMSHIFLAWIYNPNFSSNLFPQITKRSFPAQRHWWSCIKRGSLTLSVPQPQSSRVVVCSSISPQTNLALWFPPFISQQSPLSHQVTITNPHTHQYPNPRQHKWHKIYRFSFPLVFSVAMSRRIL